jgi:endonuclease/exonuclease/phosphatase family metal-dependent hydrolase
MGTILRVATINILNDLSRWDARRTLLARGLDALSPDLIALQEITDPLGKSTAHWLAGELGAYSVHVCPKSGWGRKREGIAVLSRLPVEDHEVLDLRSQQRMAQFVRVRVGESLVVFVNGHYHWLPGAHAARVRQVERVLDRVRGLDPGTSVVACGDFNGTPGSPAITLMSRTLVSAHKTLHGREPDYTCPTPLVSGQRVRGAITRGLLRLFSNRPGDFWRGTLDYIFVSADVRVVECGVFLDRPSPDDPTLYASDHLGLAATLEIPPPEVPRAGSSWDERPPGETDRHDLRRRDGGSASRSP